MIPRIGIFGERIHIMSRNTSILLGDYFNDFIRKQIKTGKYSSASEVVRAALRLFEQEEAKRTELIEELEKGEKSGFVEPFDRKQRLENLHRKHLSE